MTMFGIDASSHQLNVDWAAVDASTGFGCLIDGCTRPLWCRGWCRKHYDCWRNHGDPSAVKRIWGNDLERFWSKVGKNGPVPAHRPDLGACWLWLAPLVGGYGTFRVRSRSVKAHAYAYELLIGPVDAGLEIDHLCLNKACVNPAHLEPVTHAENMRRAAPIVRHAMQARLRSHCAQGHEFDENNTGFTREGHR